MAITVEAVYENGTLKLDKPLPLKDQERVQVTVQSSADVQKALDAVQRSYGLLRWTGDPEVLRRVALDDEFGILVQHPAPALSVEQVGVAGAAEIDCEPRAGSPRRSSEVSTAK
jgi:predicted DNA-binding antitoxin AbrB/MazE fold protein